MSRSPKKPRDASHVGDVITDNKSNFSELISHAKKLEAITVLLRGHISPDLAHQFQVAAMRQDRLTLITPNATWATRFRMQSSQMLDSLKSSTWSHLRHIDIRIAPLKVESEPIPVRRQLTPAAKLAFSLMSQLNKDNKTKSDR
jgi:hypothetical protein